MDLVLFDLDNTLLAGDSDYEWAQFLIELGVLDPRVRGDAPGRRHRRLLVADEGEDEVAGRAVALGR